MTLPVFTVPAEISSSSATRALEQLLQLVPAKFWRLRASKIRSRWGDGIVPESFLDLHRLELLVDQAIDRHTSSGRYFPAEFSIRDVELMSFCSVAASLHDQLSEVAGNYIPGRIQQGLSHEAGLRPFALELSTWNHARARGYSVCPTEILRLATYDFLLTKEDRKLALDCKYVDAEKGLSIKSAAATDYFGRAIGMLPKTLPSCHLSLLLTDTKLSDFRILPALRKVLHSETDQEQPGFTVSRRTLAGSEMEHLRDCVKLPLEERYSSMMRLLDVGRDGHIAVVELSEGRLIALSISTSRSGDVLGRVFSDLASAAGRQLPKDLPSALTVELASVHPNDALFFASRGPSDPLKLAVNDLFKRRQHLIAITFIDGRGVGSVIADDTAKTNRRSLTFMNADHPQRDDMTLISLWR